jgi:hypothetical protein
MPIIKGKIDFEWVDKLLVPCFGIDHQHSPFGMALRNPSWQ